MSHLIYRQIMSQSNIATKEEIMAPPTMILFAYFSMTSAKSSANSLYGSVGFVGSVGSVVSVFEGFSTFGNSINVTYVK